MAHFWLPVDQALAFPGGAVVKNLPANAGDTVSIPGLGRYPGEEDMATQSSISAWEIPWIEEPGSLKSLGLQKNWTRLSN